VPEPRRGGRKAGAEWAREPVFQLTPVVPRAHVVRGPPPEGLSGWEKESWTASGNGLSAGPAALIR
jgi:hypothetical protein